MQRLRMGGIVLVSWFVFDMPRAWADPPAAPDPAVVQTLLRQLDERSFPRRQEADLKLRQLGLGVVPLLRQERNLRPALEVASRLDSIIDDLLGLKWHEDLAVAQEEARRTGKLLLVVSTLGKPNGHGALAALALQAKTLSDLEVLDKLQRDFVLVWNDHLSDDWYEMVYQSERALPTFRPDQVTGYTEGRGFQTLRIFFATPDGKILSRLHGFHDAACLLREARAAGQLQDYFRNGLPPVRIAAATLGVAPISAFPWLGRQSLDPVLLGRAKFYLEPLKPVLAEFSSETNAAPPHS
jgi:hypothetical protein